MNTAAPSSPPSPLLPPLPPPVDYTELLALARRFLLSCLQRLQQTVEEHQLIDPAQCRAFNTARRAYNDLTRL
ncbi:MAG: hypothetical protein K1X67_26805, partial [Fimbriimonadaceae bacterium]|nr:hypothetical protein [Fimbriimonadaceae bacterium]